MHYPEHNLNPLWKGTGDYPDTICFPRNEQFSSTEAEKAEKIFRVQHAILSRVDPN